MGKGVCGTAWEQKRNLIVDDVHTFPGHISCSSLSKSEIVLPLILNEIVIGVLDIDHSSFAAFDKTDDYAHGGRYDQYINSAYSQDAMIADLWKVLQSIPQYKDKTSLLITCDHGRGDKIKSDWRHHGSKIADAHEIWLAVIGPDTKALGEIKTSEQSYQRQIATTLAKLLCFNFKPGHPVQEPIETIFE
jgi:hypothetical protein